MLDTYRLSGRFDEQVIISSWPEVVGTLIARHTKSLSVKNGVLNVKVDSASLKNELMFLRTELVSRLNQKAGKEIVKEIVIR